MKKVIKKVFGADSYAVFKNELFKTDSLKSGQINILSWNIQKKSFRRRLRGDLRDLQNTYPFDFIVLQEVLIKKDSTDMFNFLDMGWIFIPNIMVTNRIFSGLMIISNARPKHIKYIKTKYLEPLSQTPKAMLSATYDVKNSNSPLTIFNTHLINFVKNHKFFNQITQIESEIKEHSTPLLIAGDFNVWNKKRREHLSDLIHKNSLQVVNFNQDSKKKNTRYRFITRPTLDYILFKNLKEIQSKHIYLDSINSSDHKPLLASFEI